MSLSLEEVLNKLIELRTLARDVCFDVDEFIGDNLFDRIFEYIDLTITEFEHRIKTKKTYKHEIKCATCKKVLYEDDKRQKVLVFCSLTCSEKYKKEVK